MQSLDEIFEDAIQPEEVTIEWWQMDKIESLLHLCPYSCKLKNHILSDVDELTKDEANTLIGKLWFDHVPRDPRDQIVKRFRLNTM